MRDTSKGTLCGIFATLSLKLVQNKKKLNITDDFEAPVKNEV